MTAVAAGNSACTAVDLETPNHEKGSRMACGRVTWIRICRDGPSSRPRQAKRSQVHDRQAGVTAMAPAPLARSRINNKERLEGRSFSLHHLDIDRNARWEVDIRKRFDNLALGIQNIDHAFVDAHFKLFARIFVEK